MVVCYSSLWHLGGRPNFLRWMLLHLWIILWYVTCYIQDVLLAVSVTDIKRLKSFIIYQYISIQFNYITFSITMLHYTLMQFITDSLDHIIKFDLNIRMVILMLSFGVTMATGQTQVKPRNSGFTDQKHLIY